VGETTDDVDGETERDGAEPTGEDEREEKDEEAAPEGERTVDALRIEKPHCVGE
jgi:hypothetical protein